MSDAATEDWEELAEQLHKQGGLPERRAEVVAMAAHGIPQPEIADEMGYSSLGSVSNHIERYRDEDQPAAEWLAEHGPEI